MLAEIFGGTIVLFDEAVSAVTPAGVIVAACSAPVVILSA